MPTIKGPIKLGGGEKVPKEIAELVAKSMGLVLDESGVKPKKEVKTVESKPKYTQEELEKKDFAELKKLGYKFKVKGRSKGGLIKDILGRIKGTKKAEL